MSYEYFEFVTKDFFFEDPNYNLEYTKHYNKFTFAFESSVCSNLPFVDIDFRKMFLPRFFSYRSSLRFVQSGYEDDITYREFVSNILEFLHSFSSFYLLEYFIKKFLITIQVYFTLFNIIDNSSQLLSFNYTPSTFSKPIIQQKLFNLQLNFFLARLFRHVNRSFSISYQKKVNIIFTSTFFLVDKFRFTCMLTTSQLFNLYLYCLHLLVGVDYIHYTTFVDLDRIAFSYDLTSPLAFVDLDKVIGETLLSPKQMAIPLIEELSNFNGYFKRFLPNRPPEKSVFSYNDALFFIRDECFVLFNSSVDEDFTYFSLPVSPSIVLPAKASFSRFRRRANFVRTTKRNFFLYQDLHRKIMNKVFTSGKKSTMKRLLRDVFSVMKFRFGTLISSALFMGCILKLRPYAALARYRRSGVATKVFVPLYDINRYGKGLRLLVDCALQRRTKLQGDNDSHFVGSLFCEIYEIMSKQKDCLSVKRLIEHLSEISTVKYQNIQSNSERFIFLNKSFTTLSGSGFDSASQ